MPDCTTRNSSGTVIVLIDEYIDYPKLVVDNIHAILSSSGYGVLTIAGRELAGENDNSRHAVSNAIYALAEGTEAAGLISVSGSIGHSIEIDELISFLNRYRIPKVSLGIAVPRIPSVIVDDKNGMRTLMNHLLDDDSKQKFAFVRGYSNDPYSLKREQSFRDALQQHGRSVDESLFVAGNYDSFETYRAVAELLDIDQGIDTVVAANDLMALSAARAVTAKGLQIPVDVAVSGYDDTSEATQHSPALTTVRQPIEKLAESCVRLLLEAIENSSEISNGSQRRVSKSVRVSNELIIRGSSLSNSPALAMPDSFTAEGLVEWLQKSMSGLVLPPGVEIEEVAKVYWHTISHGSEALSDYLDKLLGPSLDYKYSHWWNNLCYQLEWHAPQILRHQNKAGRHLLIQASLATVRERVWSVSLDREFTLHQLENAQTSMQLRMSSCTELNDILLVLADWLNDIGATRSFLTRFQIPGPRPFKWSQLIQVFRNGVVEPCSDNRFLSKDILPATLREELNHGLLIMCPLYAGEDLFGYLLIDPTGLDNLDLETTAGSIGNAMRSQYLIQTMEKQALRLQSANQELYNLAQFDALTQLPNRLSFQQRLQKQCDVSVNSEFRFALLFLDLDGFKHINDSLGHDAGDTLLQAVSQRLQNLLYQQDQESIFIARLGGDEFTIIVDLSVLEFEIVDFIQKVLDALSSTFSLERQAVTVSGSVGCALFPDDGTDAKTLVKHADMAMYQAKQCGKNCMAFFNSEMGAAERRFLKLDQDMKSAIDKGEFRLHFQPRIDLETREMCGVEALMRWIVETEDGPVIRANPDEFIPVAEATGFITRLDQFALEQSCLIARRWEVAGTPLPIAVNLSVVMLQRESIVEMVTEILNRCELCPTLLELEITESDAMNDVERNVVKLSQLRDMGIRISIDDFGTGYSSLSYLKRLPINCLKIDRSFVDDIMSDDGVETVDAAIVRSVIALGKSMDLHLIAEGVETRAQADLVAEMGCNQAQGYYFARPMPLDDVEVLLDKVYSSGKAA